MLIHRYTLHNGRFEGMYVAGTLVNDTGDDTIGIEMMVDDPTLYEMLYDRFIDYENLPVSLKQNRISEITDYHAWTSFIQNMLQ